ncbi:MAG: acyl carrier protein [Chitinivibrionales bacterium]|nr:acyl carrier protein [Chitinivibrionales bacterium]
MQQHPSDEEIIERVKKILCDVLKVDRESITPASRFKENLGADSLDNVTLLMAFEDEFKQSISDAEASSLVSVESVVALIKTKQGNV